MFVIPDISSQHGASRKPIGYAPCVSGAALTEAQIAALLKGAILELQVPASRGPLAERLVSGEHLDYHGRGMQLDAANATTLTHPPASPRTSIRGA